MVDMAHKAHRPVLDRSPDADRRECAACGLPVIGPDFDLRHLGEARAIQVVPNRDDVRVFTRAEQVAADALSRLTERASDYERGRAVTEALYAAGLIVPKRKRTIVLDVDPVAVTA